MKIIVNRTTIKLVPENEKENKMLRIVYDTLNNKDKHESKDCSETVWINLADNSLDFPLIHTICRSLNN